MKKINMTNEELEALFSKYDVSDLKMIYRILDTTHEYDAMPVIEAIRKANEEKYAEMAKNFEVPVIPNNYNLMSVMKKNDRLTDKELEFLRVLILSHFNGMFAEENVSSALDSYLEFLEMVLGSIHDEQENRKVPVKKKEA